MWSWHFTRPLLWSSAFPINCLHCGGLTASHLCRHSFHTVSRTLIYLRWSTAYWFLPVQPRRVRSQRASRRRALHLYAPYFLTRHSSFFNFKRSSLQTFLYFDRHQCPNCSLEHRANQQQAASPQQTVGVEWSRCLSLTSAKWRPVKSKPADLDNQELWRYSYLCWMHSCLKHAGFSFMPGTDSPLLNF